MSEEKKKQSKIRWGAFEKIKNEIQTYPLRLFASIWGVQSIFQRTPLFWRLCPIFEIGNGTQYRDFPHDNNFHLAIQKRRIEHIFRVIKRKHKVWQTLVTLLKSLFSNNYVRQISALRVPSPIFTVRPLTWLKLISTSVSATNLNKERFNLMFSSSVKLVRLHTPTNSILRRYLAQ